MYLLVASNVKDGIYELFVAYNADLDDPYTLFVTYAKNDDDSIVTSGYDELFTRIVTYENSGFGDIKNLTVNINSGQYTISLITLPTPSFIQYRVESYFSWKCLRSYIFFCPIISLYN